MNEKFKIAIIDFIERAEEIPNLIGIVLFGSALSCEISQKNDIELLLIFDSGHNPEAREESKIAHRIASDIVTKHSLAHSFSLVFLNQKKIEKAEPDFLWNVAKEGILVWAKPKDILSREPHPSLEPMMICRYSIKGLKEKDRRGFLRHLYAGKKRIINKSEERLGPGTLLIRADKFNKIKETFDRFGIKDYYVKKLWGQRRNH